MRLLFDLDIFLYRALWGCKEGYYRQLMTCDYMIEKVMDHFESTDITLFLSGSTNFRYEVSSLYKANRKPEARPTYLSDARNYYRKYWGAVVSVDCEADDLIGLAHNDDSIVVSTDKDMLQLGGLIYNPVKNELIEIDNPEFFFYLQMLTGDQADNIVGVRNPDKGHHKFPPNFSETTAKDWLVGKDKEEMKATVEDLYFAQYGDEWFQVYDTNARLLFLKRADAEEYYERF